MSSCNFKSTVLEIRSFLDQLISDDFNTDSQDQITQVENSISTYVSENLKDNHQAINFLNSELEKRGIPIKILIDNDTHQTQLSKQFSKWDLSGGTSAMVKIFGSNITATNFVLSRFNSLATKFCIINTEARKSISNPIVDSNELLREGIANFKNYLASNLIDLLGLNKKDYQGIAENGQVGIFSAVYGSDSQLYNKLMQATKHEFEKDGKLEFDPKSTEFKNKNKNQFLIFFDIFALNNFDKLLEQTLPDIVTTNKSLSGDLNRIDYSLVQAAGDEEIFLSSDLAYENALNSVNPNIKQIISSIPKVSVNFRSKKIKYNEDSQKLTLSEVLQLSAFMQAYQAQFNQYFMETDYIDFYNNSTESFRLFLKGIYDSITQDKLNSDNKEQNSKIKDRRSFIKSMGPILSTAISLYEYLYNNDNRAQIGTRSVQSIINDYINNGRKLNLNIEELICQQIIQSTAPTMFEHNIDGSLFSQDTSNKSDVYKNNVIQKALINQQVFALKSIVRDAIQIYSLVQNDELIQDLKTVANSPKTLVEQKDTKALKNVMIKVFNIDITQEDFALDLLNEVKSSIKSIFLGIANAIENNKKPENNLWGIALQETIISQVSTILSKVDFDQISQILNPILGQAPTPIFKDRNGNSLGVYRTTSMVFMLPHIMRAYKLPKQDEKDIIDTDDTYIPLRNRCNVLVDFPDLLSNKNNTGYLSTIGIPLSMGSQDTNLEARKQPAFVQDARQFVGEFISLLLSQKNKTTTAQMAIQLGAYSDKQTLPELIVNMLVPSHIQQNNKYKAFWELLQNPINIIRLDFAHRSTNIIDQIDTILSNWSKILYKVRDNIQQDTTISQDQKSTLLEKFKEFSYTDEIRKQLLSMSGEFKKFIQGNPNKFEDILKIITDSLKQQINTLNTIIVAFKKSDIQTYIGKAASDLNIAFVDILYGDTYKYNGKKVFQFNQLLQHDLSTLTNFDTFKQYHKSMVDKYINSEYTIDSNKIPFIEYLKEVLKKSQSAIKNISKDSNIKLFEKLFTNNGIDENELKILINSFIAMNNMIRHAALDLTVKEAYEDSYKGELADFSKILQLQQNILKKSNQLDNETNEAKKISLQNELISLKEQLNEAEIAYDKSINKQRSVKQKTTTKRNNTFTASIVPFLSGTLKGISKKTKLVVIDDLPGEVFNAIGQNTDLDEFDGAGFTHPIQRRMEDASLCNTQAITAKKTFVTIIDDYYSGELKWASYEITNSLIRGSKNGKIDLETVFKRMSDIKFQDGFSLCKFYYDSVLNPKTSVSLDTLTGKKVFTRDGFDYKELLSIKKLEGEHQYQLLYKKVDSNGNYLDDNIYTSEPIIIDSIYSLYKALGGVNSLELDASGKLVPSEIVMDLLYEFTIRCGNSNIKTGESYNQNNTEQPLRKAFKGIFATKSADKRGQTNVISNKAWTDDTIPFNYTEVDLSTGGKQLDAEHTADAGTITEGTQLIQSMSQRGFTDHQTSALLNAISQVMQVSSGRFNKVLNLLKSGNIDALAEEISLRIIQDADIDGTNYDLQTLIATLKKQADEEGKPLILPLSLLTKQVIKTIGVDLNRQVIKRTDTGLQGVLNPCSGFLQLYTINGKQFTSDNLINSNSIKKLSKYKDVIQTFASNHNIDIDQILIRLQVARLNSDFNNIIKFLDETNDQSGIETILNWLTIDLQYKSEKQNLNQNDLDYEDKLLQIEDNKKYRIEAFLAAAFAYIAKTNKTSFLTLKLQKSKLIEPGDNILTKDGVVLIDQKNIIQPKENVFIDISVPSDLKPSVYVTESLNWAENTYTTEEAVLGYTINAIYDGGKVSQEEQQKVESFIEFAVQQSTPNPNLIIEPNYFITALQNKDKTVKNQALYFQEKAAQFKNDLKAHGFLIVGEPPIIGTNYDYETYYGGFNIFEDFEEQVKSKILQIVFSDKDLIKILITSLNFNEHSKKFSRTIQQLKKECYSISDKTWDIESLQKKLLENPVLGFELLNINKEYSIRALLSEIPGFQEINKDDKKDAQIIMPKIYRGQMKLGNFDLVNIDQNFYKKAPTFYNIDKDLINNSGVVEIDFAVRSFSSKYYITTTKDFNSPALNKYGDTIQNDRLLIDAEGYRINPKTKARMYKLPNDNEYIIKRKNGVETIILMYSDKVTNQIQDLLQSDSSIISVQPFMTSLTHRANIDSLIDLVNSLNSLNTLSAFEDMNKTILRYLYAAKIGKNKEILDKDAYIDLCKDLGGLYQTLEKVYKKQYQDSLYNAFLLSLDVIATRIPTQNMSSIMTMKVAAFTGSNINNVFVTKWQQWLQGSDYDIDKAFILGYNFDDNGRFLRWSPLQREYNKALMDLSLQLPLPTGKILVTPDKVYTAKDYQFYPLNLSSNNDIYDSYANALVLDYLIVNSANCTEETINDKLDLYKLENQNDREINIELINLAITQRLLERIEEIGQLSIQDFADNSIFLKELIDKLNRHNQSVPQPDAIKNFMVHKIHQIMSDHRNSITSQKSIDIATKKFTNIIEQIEDAYVYNIDDNHTIGLITESAAVGKDGVGIGANATKDYFATLQYLNNYFRLNPPFNSEELRFSPKFNLKRIKLRYTDLKGNPQVYERILGPISDARINSFQKSLYKILANHFYGKEELDHYLDDAAQDLGALLSMSADNAKTLALDKMYAGTAYFSMHLYLAMMGVPADVIINYFNSEAFQELRTFVKNDLTKGFTGELDFDIFTNLLQDINKRKEENPDDKPHLDQLYQDVVQLQEIYKCGQELTDFAAILKINQGIDIDESKLLSIKTRMLRIYENGIRSIKSLINTNSNKFYTIPNDGKGNYDLKSGNDVLEQIKATFYPVLGVDQDSYNAAIHISQKMEIANKLMEQAGISLADKLDFDRFLSDTQYQNAIKAINDIYKHTINVFDAVLDMPHFIGMLDNYNKVLTMYSVRDAQLNFEMNIMPNIYKGYAVDTTTSSNEITYKAFKVPAQYSDKLLRQTQSAYNDYVLSSFLETLKDYDFQYSSDKNTYNVSYKSDYGLHQFLDMMNEVVIPILIDTDPTNEFLRGLQFNETEHINNQNVFRGFSYNLRALQSKSYDGAVKFFKIQQAFDALASQVLFDVLPGEDNNKDSNLKNLTVGDVFWLYNTIMKQVAPSIHGFEALFSNMYANPNSLRSKYMRHTMKFDSGELQIQYDPALLLAAMFRQEARKTGNEIEFDKNILQSDPIKFKYIHNKKEVSRLLVNLPADQDVTKHIELAEAIKFGVRNGNISITFSLNC